MRHGRLLALGLSAFLMGCADEEAAETPTIRVIELIEHAENETVTDNGPMGDSVGDILTFANKLFDKANTTQVGTDQGYCIRVAVGEAWECEWTAFLAEGQLNITGPFFDAKGSTSAITGGTGAFKNASGEMALGFRDVPPPKVEYDFVYTVVLEE